VLGAGSPDASVPFYVSWKSKDINGYFINRDGKSDILIDSSTLNQFVLGKDFEGQTKQGHGIGTMRTEWEKELPKPDHIYSVTKDAINYQTSYYFKPATGTYARPGGIVVGYEDDVATLITVFREQKFIPGVAIDWENTKVSDVKAALPTIVPQGTLFTDVIDPKAFGEPDIDRTDDVTGVGKIRTLTYVQLGLSFSGTADGARVNMITVIPPYFGKVGGSATLQLGSMHPDVITFMETKNVCCDMTTSDCSTKVKCVEKVVPFTKDGKTINVYFYPVRMETVAYVTKYWVGTGFIYDERVGADPILFSVMPGFSVKK